MPLTTITDLRRYQPYKEKDCFCMNCGNKMTPGNDLYSKRFCCDGCRYEYLL